jgi:serine/threonine protein kinase
LNHPNIVTLKDVVVGKAKDSVFLVFEYCQIDLVNLMDQMNVEKLKFHENEVKCISLQIIKAVISVFRKGS